MNIGIIGSGYVGLVAAACFSEMGNEVTCVDVDENKISNLKNGIIPIYEPGLESLVKNNQSKKRLLFTTNINDALSNSEIIFIAVGTPMGDDGSADLQYVLNVAESIGNNMSHHLIVVDKSTVPVGTADKVRNVIQDCLRKRNSELTFDVVSNPEFLKEGAAIKDFMHPDRVVIGSNNEKSIQQMRQLYSPFTISSDRFISMDIRSAEMTKYAANAMLATKISFINEMSNICEKVGADVNQVRKGIGSDSRIGYKFIYPGCGYGGSCFPKDVKALINISNSVDYDPSLISAVEKVNYEQKQILFTKVKNQFGDNLSEFKHEELIEILDYVKRNKIEIYVGGLQIRKEKSDMEAFLKKKYVDLSADDLNNYSDLLVKCRINISQEENVNQRHKSTNNQQFCGLFGQTDACSV